MTYEEFENECYKTATKDPDPEYAKEGLDFAKKMGGIKELYDEGKSVESAVWLLTQ